MQSHITHRLTDKLKSIRTIIWVSVSIPVLFMLLVAVRRYLEYHYRFSATERYIYSYGSNICMFIQVALFFVSFILGILLFMDFKKYNVLERVIVFVFGASLFLYISVSLCTTFLGGIG